MGSTTFGNAARAFSRTAAPQEIEIDRGTNGRVRASDL
jgi:hypothetical protein